MANRTLFRCEFDASLPKNTAPNLVKSSEALRYQSLSPSFVQERQEAALVLNAIKLEYYQEASSSGDKFCDFRDPGEDLQLVKIQGLCKRWYIKASVTIHYTSTMPRDITWRFIKEITDDFSEERLIGRGGYGAVYKGVHEDGRVVAVKKLYHMPGLDEMQFQCEIQNLEGLHHPYIVQLVGKSYEEQDRCVEYNGRLVFATMIDRAICLEYVPNGSLEKHLYDESYGFSWSARYKIIKGICEGLEYLHQRRIFHLDLKPPNILLDQDMLPKIADFGLSRIFSGTRQSHTTNKFIGTIGYVPPEYIEKGKISEKFDVFSLGVIILKLVTGPDVYGTRSDLSSEEFIQMAHENWRKQVQRDGWKDASYLDALCQQVKTCIEIAMNCVQTERHKRPSIRDIIRILNGTETTLDETYKQLFVVQPGSLCFPFEPDKLIPCPLQITNKTDQDMPFNILAMTPNLFVGSSLRGVVPASSIVIRCCASDDLLFRAEIMEMIHHHDEIKEVSLSSFPYNQNQVTSKIQPIFKILSSNSINGIDVHPTEPWILASGWDWHLEIFNYRTEQAALNLSTLQLRLKQHKSRVSIAKFIPRKQWIVTGDLDGYMHVCCYKTMQRLKRFKAHGDDIRDLAVHPTEPYVVSISYDGARLWDWEKDWECTRTFNFADFGGVVYEATFNPNDKNTFAVRQDAGIKICSIVSPASTFILNGYEEEYIFCFDYYAYGGHEYLIVGCEDGTVKIWDTHTKSLVKEINTPDRVSAVRCCPEHSILVTGSTRGTVCLWNLPTLRDGLPRMIVVGHGGGLATMQVDHTDEAVSYSGGSQENCLIRSNKRKTLQHDQHEIENED
ncbi:hypothetical protein ACP4OV_014949 [Aristida adscensionis]